MCGIGIVFRNFYEWLIMKYQNDIEPVAQPAYEYLHDEYRALDNIMSRVVRDQLFSDDD